MGHITFTSVDRPNLATLDFLISNWDALPITEDQRLTQPRTYKARRCPILPLLKKYRKAVRNGVVPMSYQYSKNHFITGRQFSVGFSLQNMSRWLRHTLCAGTDYSDYDMVNCHPTLFAQFCKKKGWVLPVLDLYVDKRDECLAELMEANLIDRDDAKDVILSVLNGGKDAYRQLIYRPKWLVNYKNAVEEVQINIISQPEYEPLLKAIKEYKEDNTMGSIVNHILGNLENTILVEAIAFGRAKEPSLIFDGFMAFDVFDEDHLEKTSRHVFEKTGYMVKWSKKSMNEALDLTNIKPPAEPIYISGGEDESAELFLKTIKDQIRFCNGGYFLKMEGVWVHDMATINKYLRDEVMRLRYKKVVNDKAVNYSCNITDAKRIVEAVLTKVPNAPTFMKTLFESSRGKLVWNNGYWDFKSNVFHEGHTGVESIIKISRDFPKRIQSDIDMLHEKFLDPVFGHLKVPYLQYLAKCMAGHASKMWGVIMGERDSGKSKLIKLLNTAFEKYCIIVGADNFVYTRDRGSDPAKKLSWSVGMEFARMTSTSEIRVNAASHEKIDGVLIKSLTGEDAIQVRTNYTDPREMDIQSGLTICCNDIGAVTPTDAYETMVPFNLPHKFVDDPEPAFEFMKPKDSTIGDFVRETKYGDALFWLLTDHYSSNTFVLTPEMKEFKAQFLEVDEFALINEHFVITKNEKDFVSNDTIKKFLRESHINLTGTKFKDYLIKRGARDHTLPPPKEGEPSVCRRGLRYVAKVKEFQFNED